MRHARAALSMSLLATVVATGHTEEAPVSPVTLTVYSDYVCPWCYLGSARIERLQRAYAIEIEYVHFPLHPDTPDDGQRLIDLFGGESARPRLEESHAQLKALAEAEGLELAAREMTYNSRLAQELGSWAETRGAGPAFHDAAYRAYFVDGEDISDAEVLVRLAERVGLDPEAAREVLETRSQRHAVDADWSRARQMGITGVPTFMAGGDRVVGAQPYEILEELVKAAGATRRAEEG